MNKSKSFFIRVFGEDMGEIVQLFVGFFVIMGMMIGGPILLTKISSSSSKAVSYKEILSNSKETTKYILKELLRYDSLTTRIEKRIDNELFKEKDLINQKRELLIELQNDFDSIYLTPQQLALLSSVTPEKNNISFSDWISSTNQLYGIGVSLIISFFFYYLGKREGKNTI